MLVYRMAPNHFMLVVNASNIAKDYAWISAQIKAAGDAAAVDSSSRYALIAIQGPAALERAAAACTASTSHDIKYYWFTHGEVASARALISRTGYTGEDGFEIFVPPNMADRVWQAILESGRSADVIPCGLGARDTLRLEAAMRLYGNDIDETTTVLEADLGWIVGWKKAIVHRPRAPARAEGRRASTRKLVGFEMIDRGIARHGYQVVHGDEADRCRDERHADAVPEEGHRHGLRADRADARLAQDLTIDVRGRASRATVVPLPFLQSSEAGQTCRSEMAYPADRKYTKDHEWIRIDGRYRRNRHHRLRAAAARRRGLRRAA